MGGNGKGIQGYHTGEAKPDAKPAFKREERQRPVLRVATSDYPMAGEGLGNLFAWVLTSSLRALHQPGAAAVPRDAALAPGTSKAAQAAREPADLWPPQAVLLSVGLCTAGQTDKSTSYSPSTFQPRRTMAAPTEHGRARGSTLAQETTPHLPRTIVNQSGEERLDIHHDHSWHTGWLWTGPASAAQTDCCSGVLHTGSCSTRPAGSKSFLQQHQQEPLTWFQPGFHPELIRSCS